MWPPDGQNSASPSCRYSIAPSSVFLKTLSTLSTLSSSITMLCATLLLSLVISSLGAAIPSNSTQTLAVVNSTVEACAPAELIFAAGTGEDGLGLAGTPL